MPHMVEEKNHQISGTVHLDALIRIIKNVHEIIHVAVKQHKLTKNVQQEQKQILTRKKYLRSLLMK